jgi:hypothetical protein
MLRCAIVGRSVLAAVLGAAVLCGTAGCSGSNPPATTKTKTGDEKDKKEDTPSKEKEPKPDPG